MKALKTAVKLQDLIGRHGSVKQKYTEIRNNWMEDVIAVVMELNGEITVVKKSDCTEPTSLEDIDLPDPGKSPGPAISGSWDLTK